jgi:hypothetical protein
MRRRLFSRLPAAVKDHAAGCPACQFFRDGTVKVCFAGVTS